MSIPLRCSCGKTLRVADSSAGKRVKCPGCGAALAVSPPAAAAESPEVYDDFEMVEDDPAPKPKPAPAARVKAAVAEEPPAPPPAAKPKKKKKKKAAPVEGDDDWYEQMREREAWLKRMTRGGAYVVFGLAILIGVAVIYFGYWEEVKSTGGRTVVGIIIFGVVGLLAVGKGVIGMTLGQFLGDDDD